jgi:S1-C subfamily serine protease
MTRRAAALRIVALAVLAAGCGGRDRTGAPPPVLRVAVTVDALLPAVATGVATGNGRVLTVAHVLAGGHAVTVSGRRARVLRVDRRLDLALLAAPGVRAPVVRLRGDAGSVRLAVLRAGRRRMLAGTVRRRVLIHWHEQPGDRARLRPGLELAAQVDPGDSGAPVVDRTGRLLGVLFARSSDGDATAWAVGAPALARFLAGSARAALT